MALRVVPTTPTLGATVTGIDLASVTAGDIEAVIAAILEHKVLFFAEQNLSPEAQLAFARHLGEIDVAPFGPKHADYPEMTVLDQVSPKNQGADAWHTDNTYLPCPPSFTILQSVMLPELGGDTCFADMYAAFDALSSQMQAFLCELTATHDLTKTLKRAIADDNADVDLAMMQQQWPPVHHPVVRVHPDTGRKALFVNGNFTTKNRRPHQHGERGVPFDAARAHQLSGIPVSPSLDWWHVDHVGQPLRTALRGARLHQPPSHAPPNHHRYQTHRSCGTHRLATLSSATLGSQTTIYLPDDLKKRLELAAHQERREGVSMFVLPLAAEGHD